MYKGKHVGSSGGQFGVFGNGNRNFAYLVNSESVNNYYFLNYVIQSGSTNLETTRAKTQSIFSELNNILITFE